MEEQKKQEFAPEKSKSAHQELHCSNCSSVLVEGQQFCSECGASVNSECAPCPVCNEISNTSYCNTCGSFKNGYICKNCSNLAYTEFCPHCGEANGQIALQMVQIAELQVNHPPTIMAEEEANQYIAELEASMSAEKKAFEKKLRQRAILEKERNYFNEREEKIEKSKNYVRKVNLLNKEDLAKINQIIKSIDRSLGLDQIKSELKEERDRELQLQQKNLEIEDEKHRELNAINGIWTNSRNSVSIVIKLSNNNGVLEGQAKLIEGTHERIDKMQGTLKGNSIHLYTVSMRVIHIGLFWRPIPVNISGELDPNGRIIRAYVKSNEFWQDCFFK